MSIERSAGNSADHSAAEYIIMRRRVIRIILYLAFLLLPFAVIFRDVPSIRSLVLGLAVALLNFHLLGRSVESAVSGSARAATRKAVKYFLVRYVIIGLGLCIVVRLGAGAIIAFVAGLLLPQAVMVLGGLSAGRSTNGSTCGAADRRL